MDNAIMFPIVVKYVVVVLCIAGLGIKYYMMTRTDGEFEQMGVDIRRNNG